MVLLVLLRVRPIRVRPSGWRPWEVAKDAGATVNQVVLAWLISAEVSMIPLVGVSSVAQLDESLAVAR